MNKRERSAQLLIGLGCLVLLIGSALHLGAAYPKVSAALAGSNLDGLLKNALRSVFAMIGITWIVIAVIALIVTFMRTRTSKLIVLVCGAALLFQIPIWAGLMGWFVGNEMFLVAAALIITGGCVLPRETDRIRL